MLEKNRNKQVSKVEYVLHNIPEDKNPKIIRSEFINIITNHINKNISHKKYQHNRLSSISNATKHLVSDKKRYFSSAGR